MQNESQDETGPKIIDSFNGILFEQKLRSSKKMVIYQTLRLTTGNQYPSCNIPLTLQNIEYHRNNLHSLQNTSITPSMLENQFHSKQCSKEQILVIDTSHNYDQKQIPQIFKQYDVIKGFTYCMDKQALKNSGFLYQFEHIKTQIEYEFKLGNGVYLPSFIGQLDLGYLMELYQQFANDEIIVNRINNVLKAYCLFSSLTKCPIFINCFATTNGLGSLKSRMNQSFFVTSHQQKQQKLIISEFMCKVYQRIQLFLSLAAQFKSSQNVVLINPPILLIHAATKENQITKTQICNQFQERLNKLKDLYNFTTLFQFLRCQNIIYIDHIASQVKRFQKSTLLTPGIKFKTDLKIFGGKGLFASSVFQYLLKFCSISQKQLGMVTQQNFIDILSWKRQKKVVVEIKYWKCDGCLKDFQQKIQAFRKHGKQFCSTKCLRAFNF